MAELGNRHDHGDNSASRTTDPFLQSEEIVNAIEQSLRKQDE